MRQLNRAWALAPLGLLMCSGCISLLGPEDLRFRLSLAHDVGLDREFTVGVDGWTVRTAAAFADVQVPLEGLHWVDFGAYRIRGDSRNMVSNAKFRGWERMVRMRDNGEEVCVFVKQNHSKVKGMIALVREDDELFVVRLRGRIDRLIRNLLEQEEFGFDLEELLGSVEDAG